MRHWRCSSTHSWSRHRYLTEVAMNTVDLTEISLKQIPCIHTHEVSFEIVTELWDMILYSVVDTNWSCAVWYHAVWLICTDLVKCDTKQCWYILILCNAMLWLMCTDLTEDLLLQVWGRSATLITKATCSSEIYLHIYQTTWYHRPRRHLHVHKVLLMLLVTTEKYSFKLEDFFQTTVLRGYAVAHLVEALCYKLEDCGFDALQPWV